MFSRKTVLIFLSMLALIAGQQNGTEDYDDYNDIFMNENITQSSFQSDSLIFNDSTVVPETSETDLEDTTNDSTETIQPLEANNESDSLNDMLYTVDADYTTTTIDEYIPIRNNSNVTTKFSCYGRQFGQYADVDKHCRVFHMCYPLRDSVSGRKMFQRITFLCDDDSVFDQQNLVCAENSSVAHLCSDSVKYYNQSNVDFLTAMLNQFRAIMSGKPDNVDIDGIINTNQNPTKP